MNKTFTDTGWDDYLYWHKKNLKTFDKINTLVNYSPPKEAGASWIIEVAPKVTSYFLSHRLYFPQSLR